MNSGLFRILYRFAILLSLTGALSARGAAAEERWVPLFNGRDLEGWTNVNCAPSTWSVRDGMIVCTGKPTGVMRTLRHFENFIVELEWKHLREGGNAGFFVFSDALTSQGVPFTRAIEVQIIDGNSPEGVWTGHGDVFSIHGARFVPDRPHPRGWERCLPSERRAKPAGEWNHYRVECRDGRLTLAVNGKVVSGGSNCVPRRGYICLESEGSEVHFRNLRITELPSSNPATTEVATLDEGFHTLYTGVDLAGWRATPEIASHWEANDWTLVCTGLPDGSGKDLATERDFGDFALIADWRWTRKPESKRLPVILPSGEPAKGADGTPLTEEVADAGDSGILLRGDRKAEVNMWCWPAGSGELWGYRTDSNLSPEVRAAATPRERADLPPGRWNRFVITLRGDRLNVLLNGKMVINNASLPGIPARGPIVLQHDGNPVEFANLYVKEM